MPHLPTSCLVHCQQFLASSFPSKLLLQASFQQRDHYGLIKANHFSNDVQAPSNLVEQDETQKAKFSPSRSRDTSSAHVASRLDVAGAGRVFGRGLDSNSAAGSFNASNMPIDSHFTMYDQANSCSLSSVMQTNVPEPFNAHGDADYSSHLSMPGGQWAQNDKYLSADLHDHHYQNSINNDDLKKGEINQNIRTFNYHGCFTGAFPIANNKHLGSRHCLAAASVYNANTFFQRQRTVTPPQTCSTTPQFSVKSNILRHVADLVDVQLGTQVTNMPSSNLVGTDCCVETINDVYSDVKKMIHPLPYPHDDSLIQLNTQSPQWRKSTCGLNFKKRSNYYPLLTSSGITHFSQTYYARAFSSKTHLSSNQTLFSDWLASCPSLLLSCPFNSRGQCLPLSRSLTTSTLNKSEVSNEEKKDPPVLSSRQKLQQTVKDYGATVVVFHVTISLASLGLCYLLVSSGIDMAGLIQSLGIDLTTKDTTLTTVPDPAAIAVQPSTLPNTDTKTSPNTDSRSHNLSATGSVAAGVSTFVVAYAVHKVFAPARIAITLTATPLIVRRLRAKGFLKPPIPRR